MSMSVFLEKNIEAIANDYFEGENVGGLKVSGVSLDVEDFGDYHIWLFGVYEEDFMYLLKNNEYYGGVIRDISEKLDQIYEDAQDYNNGAKREAFIQDKVDELWRVVEPNEGDIYETLSEGLSEQMVYASSDFQNIINNYTISSEVGGVDVDEFTIGEYFEEVNGSRVFIAVMEEASIVLNDFDKETLKNYIEL